MELALRKCFERCFLQLLFRRCCSLRREQFPDLFTFRQGLKSADGREVRMVHSDEHFVRIDMHFTSYCVRLFVLFKH